MASQASRFAMRYERACARHSTLQQAPLPFGALCEKLSDCSVVGSSRTAATASRTNRWQLEAGGNGAARPLSSLQWRVSLQLPACGEAAAAARRWR